MFLVVVPFLGYIEKKWTRLTSDKKLNKAPVIVVRGRLNVGAKKLASAA